MTKAELRTIYKAKRQKLSAEAIELASLQICNQWQEYMNRGDIFSAKDVTSVHVFLPIQVQREVNTWPIIHTLWQNHPAIDVVTSIADFKTGTLHHVRLTAETHLVVNQYGIPEPDPIISASVSAKSIDMVLVPLLISDRRCHRVGYGKGFYDRFLAECRRDCLKVGLSLFDPVELIDDTVETDVALNLCITPKQVWHFS